MVQDYSIRASSASILISNHLLNFPAIKSNMPKIERAEITVITFVFILRVEVNNFHSLFGLRSLLAWQEIKLSIYYGDSLV